MAGTCSSPSPQKVCISWRALRQRQRCLMAKIRAEEAVSFALRLGFGVGTVELLKSHQHFSSLPCYQQTEGESSTSLASTLGHPHPCAWLKFQFWVAMASRVPHQEHSNWVETHGNVLGRVQQPSQGSLCRSGNSEGRLPVSKTALD